MMFYLTLLHLLFQVEGVSLPWAVVCMGVTLALAVVGGAVGYGGLKRDAAESKQTLTVTVDAVNNLAKAVVGLQTQAGSILTQQNSNTEALGLVRERQHEHAGNMDAHVSRREINEQFNRLHDKLDELVCRLPKTGM